ncbi:MAG: hypothetical protein ABSF74_03780 [Dehalococcoidia bacterium]|jgi:hypothetical protein
MKIKAQFIKMAFTMLLSFVILACSFLPSQIVNAANVTITLYIYPYGSTSGSPALTGVLVTGKDGNGASFSQTVDVSGNVSITGATGAWTFTASMYGYQTSTWVTYIPSSTTLQVFLIPSAQSPSGYPY